MVKIFSFACVCSKSQKVFSFLFLPIKKKDFSHSNHRDKASVIDFTAYSSKTLAVGASVVVAHTKAQSSTILAADFVDEELQISGNDGVALTCLSTVIDAIGGAVSNAFNIDIFTRAHKTID